MPFVLNGITTRSRFSEGLAGVLKRAIRFSGFCLRVMFGWPRNHHLYF
jgi:hypothetical protein